MNKNKLVPYHNLNGNAGQIIAQAKDLHDKALKDTIGQLIERQQQELVIKDILQMVKTKNIRSRYETILAFIMTDIRKFRMENNEQIAPRNTDMPSLIINGNGQSYTDGKSITVSVPHMFLGKMQMPEYLVMLKGLLIHEVLHIWFSDFNGYKAYIKWVQDYLFKTHSVPKHIGKMIATSFGNGVEDGRIEYWGTGLLTGTTTPIESLRHFWYKHQPVSEEVSPKTELFDFLFGIVTLATVGMYPKGYTEKYADNQENLDRLANLFPIISEAVSCRSNQEALDLCKEMIKSCGSYFEQLVKDIQEDPSDSGQGGESQQGSGSGESSQSQQGQGGGSSQDSEDDEDENENQDANQNGSSQGKDDKGKDDKNSKGKGQSSKDEKENEDGNDSQSSSDGQDDDQTDNSSNQKQDSMSGGNKNDKQDSSKENKNDITMEEFSSTYVITFGNDGEEKQENMGDKSISEEEAEQNEKELNSEPKEGEMEENSNIDSEVSDMAKRLKEAMDYQRERESYQERNEEDILSPEELEEILNNYNQPNSPYYDATYEEIVITDMDSYELPENVVEGAEQIRETLIELLKAKEKSVQRHLRRGRVDTRNLYKVAVGSENIMKLTDQERKTSLCAYLLQDGSGSMGGEKWLASSMIYSTLETAFKGIIPLKMTVFNASGRHAIHEIIKDWSFEDPIMNYAESYFKHHGPGGNNFDGLSIRIATEEILKRNEKDKVLFVLSDGLPSAYHSNEEAITDVREAVQQAEANGVIVISVIIGDKQFRDNHQSIYEEMYGRNVISCELDEIADEISDVITRLVETR